MSDESTIYLRETASGRLVEARLRDAIEEAQLVDWHMKWRPALLAAMEDLVRRKVPIAEWWPENPHWDWKRKATEIQGLLGFQGFCVVQSDLTQGLMRVDLTQNARLDQQRGKPLVYIDYLETAPWNRAELGAPPRLRGVGTALVTAAIALSMNEGFKGRIGLHALPRSNTFYAEKCGMTLVGADANCQGLNYYEVTPEQAETFLGKEN